MNSSDLILLSDNIIDELDRDVLSIKYSDDLDEAKHDVEEGNAWAVIYFPKYFTRDVFLTIQNTSYTGNNSIFLKVDKTNVNIDAAVNKEVQEAMLEAIDSSGNSLPISIDNSDPVYGRNTDFIDFLVQGGFFGIHFPLKSD